MRPAGSLPHTSTQSFPAERAIQMADEAARHGRRAVLLEAETEITAGRALDLLERGMADVARETAAGARATAEEAEHAARRARDAARTARSCLSGLDLDADPGLRARLVTESAERWAEFAGHRARVAAQTARVPGPAD